MVDTHRIGELIEKHNERFLNRVFTQGERAYCEKMRYPAPHYAARFAAKEAISKAFGTGIGENLHWIDMEILRNDLGKPHVKLTGEGKAFAEKNGISSVMISLSHSDNHAAANAMAVVD